VEDLISAVAAAKFGQRLRQFEFAGRIGPVYYQQGGLLRGDFFETLVLLLLINGPKCGQLDVLHLIEHHELFGLDKGPKELFLKDLILMQEGAISDLSLEHLLGEVPVLG
jgi:hypothetical protein